MTKNGRVLVLDRDGVLNKDVGTCLTSVSQWEWIEGSIEALKRLSERHFPLYIASNQSAVGRGTMSDKDLQLIHEHMAVELEAHGVKLHGAFYCTHRPEEQCKCRKPRPGLLRMVASDYGCRTTDLIMVGDQWSDLEAARECGAVPVLVRTGKGQSLYESGVPEAQAVFKNLLELSYLL